MTLAVAALVVWFALAPQEPNSAEDRSALISQALEDAEANESSADTAPQQQVVNGWVARDLLSVIAMQQTDQADLLIGLTKDSRDERPAALLVLLVLGAGLALGTSTSPTPDIAPRTEA